MHENLKQTFLECAKAKSVSFEDTFFLSPEGKQWLPSKHCAALAPLMKKKMKINKSFSVVKSFCL